jgi:TolB protein
MAFDGSDVRRLRLTDPTLNLIPNAWSPDGSRIAFEGWDDGDAARSGVYTDAFPRGGDVRRITTAPDGYHDIPADWSPDGASIVFYRSAIGDAWDQDGPLWVVGADGGEPRRIETPFNPSWWVRWSPDGTQLLFASGRLEREGTIWTVAADGSNLTAVFTDAEGRFPITPTWSPDGQWILFGLDPINDEFQHPSNGVYVIRSDGTGLALVIGGDDFKRRFDWIR